MKIREFLREVDIEHLRRGRGGIILVGSGLIALAKTSIDEWEAKYAQPNRADEAAPSDTSPMRVILRA